ncbi:Histidinol-phosphate aminotransferase [Vibrio stylophorae]|uniref:Histidinol-phosphate aminotransferase n=1 Tax=Vibrio stylophorae TaxID=659351 RepID=A0ABM8ZS13_9VIBR|nr:histidinol-phosphate transaminase [Vibrio stylophorae]CAH0533084.1 Histidinol-phosphate aminotransferase [Vibrio stylophorae]
MNQFFLTLANAGVRGLSPYQAGKPIDELKRELGLTDVVKLASNENPLGLSAKAEVAMVKAMADLTRYPDANGFTLKQRISQIYGVDAKQVTLGNGSNDLLELIAHTFASSDDEIIFSQYAFVVYQLATQAIGAKAVVTPAKDWGNDLDAMLAAITERTKLIFIANPNNPTGTYLQPEQLANFLAKVPENVLVVLDEAYIEYLADDENPQQSIAWTQDYPNLLVTRTFSKAFGLAGLRVGFCVAHPAVTDLLNRVRQPFNCSALALAAATAVLDDHEYLKRTRAMNDAGMTQLCAEFDAQGLAYIPSKGNFVTVDFGKPAAAINQALLERGVIVRPLAPYQMPNHLRVSIGTQAENDTFITALRAVLATQ